MGVEKEKTIILGWEVAGRLGRLRKADCFPGERSGTSQANHIILNRKEGSERQAVTGRRETDSTPTRMFS